MKAAVFHKPGDISYDTVPDPRIIEEDDIIVRVTSTAICGSDLHLYNGFMPQVKDMVVGHEFMGIVEEKGPGVNKLEVGDRVVVPFVIACGSCFFCNNLQFPNCEHTNPKMYGPEGHLTKGKGAGLFGYTDMYGGYDGGQAEFVRVPKANVGPKKIPEGLTDEEVLFLTDIFPTGWSAVKWANVKPGDTVAIFGSGPVGLMAQKAAWLNGAEKVIAIDPLEYRRQKAIEVNNVEAIDADDKDMFEKIRSMTGGRGADCVIDAVGMEPERSLIDRAKAVINFEKGSCKVMENCFEAVRRGGNVSVVGVYASNYDNFPVHQIFEKGLTIQMGQAPVQKYIDELFELVSGGRVKLNDIITHRMPLSEVASAYDLFRNKKDDCVKVVLKPGM